MDLFGMVELAEGLGGGVGKREDLRIILRLLSLDLGRM